MAELIVPASISSLAEVQIFIESKLSEHDCSSKVQNQILIAVEELFVNIAYYAYPNQKGKVNIECSFQHNPDCAVIVFVDSGIPFDPFAKEDADISLGIEERKIGGLGIFMVKKTMDTVNYAFENGTNKVTIKKNLRCVE